jgi:hypothetical protein
MKIQDVLSEKFDPSDREYHKQTVQVKNSSTAKLPNEFDNKHVKPVAYRNGNSVNDKIGLDFSSHDYNKDDSSTKEGTSTKKKKRVKAANQL